MMTIIHRAAREAAQVFTPDPARLYTYLHPPIVAGDFISAYEVHIGTGRENLWVNLGYWRDIEPCTVDNYERWPELLTRAQVALADRLGEAAGLHAGDDVLDCGFGYGDQDIHWLERHGPATIVGLNITPEQVRVATERARVLGYADRLDFRSASATSMPITSESFDVVLALESAFHFDTRQQFLTESARVLRPGGRLAIADMLCRDDRRATGPRRLIQALYRRRFHVPSANMWTPAMYRHNLERLGFEDVRVESIAEHVYKPFRRQWVQFSGEPRRARIRRHLRRIDNTPTEKLPWQRLTGLDEYAIITARLPG